MMIIKNIQTFCIQRLIQKKYICAHDDGLSQQYQLLKHFIQQYRMGNQLCPDKQIIHDIQEFDKVEVKFDLFFKQYTNQNPTKLQSQVNEHSLSNQGQMKQMMNKSEGILNLSGIQTNKVNKQEQKYKQKIDPIVQNVQKIIQQQIIFQDGSKYIGQTKNSLPHGKGEEINANGDYYKGDFEYGMKNGFGIYQFGDCSKYEGTFLNNKMSGRGLYYFPNGDKYEGEFSQNERHGKGTYYIKQPNKEKLLMFEGCYSEGLKQGDGKLLCVGSVIEGVWSKGIYRFNENFNLS